MHTLSTQTNANNNVCVDAPRITALTLAAARALHRPISAARAQAAANGRYRLITLIADKPQSAECRCCCRSTGQADGETDGHPFVT